MKILKKDFSNQLNLCILLEGKRKNDIYGKPVSKAQFNHLNLVFISGFLYVTAY